MKNIRFFLSEKFQFLEVKFSIQLNRRVFVTGLCFVIVVLFPWYLHFCFFKQLLNIDEMFSLHLSRYRMIFNATSMLILTE